VSYLPFFCNKSLDKFLFLFCLFKFGSKCGGDEDVALDEW